MHLSYTRKTPAEYSFVTTPATSIFTKLPAPSPEASATSAIAAGIKHLHPVSRPSRSMMPGCHIIACSSYQNERDRHRDSGLSTFSLTSISSVITLTPGHTHRHCSRRRPNRPPRQSRCRWRDQVMLDCAIRAEHKPRGERVSINRWQLGSIPLPAQYNCVNRKIPLPPDIHADG